MLKDANGNVVAAGTRAQVGGTEAIVGWDGLLFIENLGAVENAGVDTIVAVLPDGSHCRSAPSGLSKKAISETANIADLGDMICR